MHCKYLINSLTRAEIVLIYQQILRTEIERDIKQQVSKGEWTKSLNIHHEYSTLNTFVSNFQSWLRTVLTVELRIYMVTQKIVSHFRVELRQRQQSAWKMPTIYFKSESVDTVDCCFIHPVLGLNSILSKRHCEVGSLIISTKPDSVGEKITRSTKRYCFDVSSNSQD